MRPPDGGSIYAEIAHEAMTTPPLRAKSSTRRISLEDGITTSVDPNGKFQLTAQWVVQPGLRFDSVVQRQPDETKVALSQGAEVELRAIGSMYAVGVEPADQRFRIYDPTGTRLLGDTEMAELGIDMEQWRRSMILTPGTLRVFAVFDGPFQRFSSPSQMTPDTYRKWSTSSIDHLGDRIYTAFEDYRWHNGGVEFVWDIAHGKLEEATAPAEAGELLTLSDCELKVVAIEPGQYLMKEVRKRYGGKFAVEETTQSIGTQGCTVFVTTDSPQLWQAMDCVLLDKAGKPLRKSSHFWPDKSRIAAVCTNAAPEEVAQVKIQYRSAMDRVLFNIPKVPGVPEENIDPENLFNVRIPYLEITDSGQFAEVLAGGTQLDMDFNYSILDNPTFYPRTFKDVSMRQLLEEAQEINNGRRLVLDLSEYSIRQTRRPEWLETLCNWFESVGDWF